MPTGLMPNDINAAASPACAMIRVGGFSAVITLPEPSVNDQGPDEVAAAPGESPDESPQPASATLSAVTARTVRHARIYRESIHAGWPKLGQANHSIAVWLVHGPPSHLRV